MYTRPMVASGLRRSLSLRYAASVTYDEPLELARRNEGRILQTPTGKRFTVGLYLDTPILHAAVLRSRPSDGRKAAERFLARYNEIRSCATADHGDVTRNASDSIGMVTGDANR